MVIPPRENKHWSLYYVTMHTGNKQQSVKFLKSFWSALCSQGKIIRIVGIAVLHRMAKPAKQASAFRFLSVLGRVCSHLIGSFLLGSGLRGRRQLIGTLSKDVFERRPSTGSEAFSLFICLDANKLVLLSFFSLLKTIYSRVSTKPLPNDAKSPLPVDVRRSKTLLLKLPNSGLILTLSSSPIVRPPA